MGKYNSMSAKSPKVVKSDDTEVNLLDETLNAKKVTDQGVYNATPITLTNGQSAPKQIDQNGNVKVTIATALDKVNDSITSALATDAIMNGATALTPKFAPIALSATGTVVAAVTAKKIRVLGFIFVAAGTVNVNFQSHTTTTTKTGLSYLVANSGVSSGFFPVGLFETVAGEALDLALSASIAVGGQVVYVEV